MSCKLAVEEYFAGKASEQKKTAHTQKAEKSAVFYSAEGSILYFVHVSQGICLGDDREKQYGNRAGKGIGEENQRHCHAGKHAIDAEGGSGVVAVKPESGGNGNGFYALQQIQHNAVRRKRQRHSQNRTIDGT